MEHWGAECRKIGELRCTSMLIPSRSLTGVPPPSGSVAEIWLTFDFRGGIAGVHTEWNDMDG